MFIRPATDVPRHRTNSSARLSTEQVEPGGPVPGSGSPWRAGCLPVQVPGSPVSCPSDSLSVGHGD